MSNFFYVKNNNGELIPAEFLRGTNGLLIQDRNLIDVNPVNSRNGHYYDAVGNELVKFNPNNYLVVPINFNLQAAIDFGKSLQGRADIYYQMTNAFISVIAGGIQFDGTYNLQRTYQNANGIYLQNASQVPMFQDATSFVLGAVSAQNGTTDKAITGGGVYNWWFGGNDISGEAG